MIIVEEAEIVRTVYRLYVEDGLSINAIARWLNDHQIPTRKRISLWERSTIWAMLRNPAYQGTACFGKTRSVERKKITRPLRQRGGFSPRCSANQECPREDWIEIPVPAIIDKDLFQLAQERLKHNKKYSLRRTIEPTLSQGMLVCKSCGYAYYRTSTRTSKRKLYYYRCLGSDNYRFPKGRVCQNRPIRQDHLDGIIWQKVVELLSNPDLVKAEINRRVEEIQSSNPTKRRKESIEKELLRLGNNIQRLLDAYQEDLIKIEELRDRMPQLRKRQKALQSELASLECALSDQKAVFRLATNIESFLDQLKSAADTLSVEGRQKVLRLIVREILIDDETVTIKHSIPLPNSTITEKSNIRTNIPGYLLRSSSHFTGAFEHIPALCA
jgi:site-specific DNA recombinase